MDQPQKTWVKISWSYDTKVQTKNEMNERTRKTIAWPNNVATDWKASLKLNVSMQKKSQRQFQRACACEHRKNGDKQRSEKHQTATSWNLSAQSTHSFFPCFFLQSVLQCTNLVSIFWETTSEPTLRALTVFILAQKSRNATLLAATDHTKYMLVNYIGPLSMWVNLMCRKNPLCASYVYNWIFGTTREVCNHHVSGICFLDEFLFRFVTQNTNTPQSKAKQSKVKWNWCETFQEFEIFSILKKIFQSLSPGFPYIFGQL